MDRIDAFRVYVRVVETGSFSRAARDLGITQPTVTRQVASLEQRLGGRLLNRNTRRLSVTDLGQVYYERGKALLDLFEEVSGRRRPKLRQSRRLCHRRRWRPGSRPHRRPPPPSSSPHCGR